jgi:hypothetical protein
MYFQGVTPTRGGSARHGCDRALSKKIRSLKIEIPPPAELAEWKKRVLSELSQFDCARDKFSIDPRKKPIIEKIAKKLLPHINPGLSEVQLYNQVVLVAFVAKYPKPSEVEEITDGAVGAAKKLLRVLSNPDFPPNYMRRVSDGDVVNWNKFIESLERLAAITYKKPPKNEDPVKRECAINAYWLITEFTKEIPTRTRGGIFYEIASLLFQVNCLTASNETDQLRSTCNKLLDRVDKGFNPGRDGPRDRW